MIVHLVLLGTAAVAALMLVLWLIHLVIGNAAIVDAGWAGGLAILSVLYAHYGGGYTARAAMIALMASVWGVRLALYLLFTRLIGQPEEGRYQELRRQWKTNIPLKFLAFFEFQALLCVLLSAPFLFAAINPLPVLSTVEYAAAGLWFIALIGEIVADGQLGGFKTNPANRGKLCSVGLWRYSRHPNYFFESLIWLAYALFALASPWGWIGLISPALILWFLLKVTGIPATEAQALRSKGEAYRRYQETTSMFIPWFPREPAKR
jgi:steroid 5-alpha reductase family enzyme